MSVFPVYVFDARTGVLHYNAFGRRQWLKARQLREVTEIIAYLQAEALAGRIGAALTIGWGGSGIKPAAAVDIHDAKLMAAWFDRAFKIVVRVTGNEHILEHERGAP